MTKKRKRSLCSLYHFGFICLWKTFKPFSTSVNWMTLKPLKYSEIFSGGKKDKKMYPRYFFLQILLMNNSKCWGSCTTWQADDKPNCLIFYENYWHLHIVMRVCWGLHYYIASFFPACFFCMLVAPHDVEKCKCNKLNCKKKNKKKILEILMKDPICRQFLFCFFNS